MVKSDTGKVGKTIHIKYLDLYPQTHDQFETKKMLKMKNPQVVSAVQNKRDHFKRILLNFTSLKANECPFPMG